MARSSLAAVAAIVGFCGITFSLAQALGKTAPALAHRLAPYDGRITARLAASMAGIDASPVARHQSDVLARRALVQNATAVLAVSTLGMNAQVHGDTDETTSLFVHAEKLSRRDVPTQIWSIEDSVARGDVAGALRHYDTALRTSPATSALLYPILAAASADPSIRSSLIRTLGAKPHWGENFVEYLADNTADPRSTAEVFLGLQRVGVPPSDRARTRIVNVLIGKGDIDAGWRYYAAGHPGADRRRSRDQSFTAVVPTPSVLDWTPIEDARITAVISGDLFDFFAPASVGGPLLRQMQLLPPGDYRLSGRSTGIEQAANALPYWVLTCGSDRELGRVALPNSAQANGIFTGTFSVPLGCPVQTLTLIARPSDTAAGLSGQILEARLMPVGQGQ